MRGRPCGGRPGGVLGNAVRGAELALPRVERSGQAGRARFLRQTLGPGRYPACLPGERSNGLRRRSPREPGTTGRESGVSARRIAVPVRGREAGAQQAGTSLGSQRRRDDQEKDAEGGGSRSPGIAGRGLQEQIRCPRTVSRACFQVVVGAMRGRRPDRTAPARCHFIPALVARALARPGHRLPCGGDDRPDLPPRARWPSG